MANKNIHLPIAHFGESLRKDNWWAGPAATVLVLAGFIVYATWRAFEGTSYEHDAYLSPFYSPFFDVSWARAYGLGFFTPAMLILPVPASFRFTCYYYRKAYYRAFFLDPPACAVGEPASRRYNGETKFPFILQNLHRYFLYLAILFLVFLWHDVVLAFNFDGHFGIGVGTLVLLLNVTLLSIYTLSCHSLRHLAGGKTDCFSCASFGKPRYKLWSGLSRLNERHMLFAWASLITVGFADFYIRLAATGAIHDLRIL
jgi:hypothetical protein